LLAGTKEQPRHARTEDGGEEQMLKKQVLKKQVLKKQVLKKQVLK